MRIMPYYSYRAVRKPTLQAGTDLLEREIQPAHFTRYLEMWVSGWMYDTLDF